MTPPPRRYAVVGAGWAGLAAALELRRRGHVVHLYEAARMPGGRARRAAGTKDGAALDNGQHILLGAYSATLGLIRELGLDAGALLHRERLALCAADGSFALRAAALPAPFHLLGGLALAHGLSVRERIGVARQIVRLRQAGWRAGNSAGSGGVRDGSSRSEGGRMGDTISAIKGNALSAEQWLQAGGQSPRAIERLWRPLCIAALNTPPAEASAQLLANVLRDSVGTGAAASDILIPRVDLSSLWPDAAITRLGAGSIPSSWAGAHAAAPAMSAVFMGRTVRTLAAAAGSVLVDGQPYDGVVIAANVPPARRLLHQLPDTPGGAAFLAMLDAFDFIPIATLSLRLARPWGLRAPMQMLWEDPTRLAFGQWLFDHSALRTTRTQGHPSVHIVVSDARALLRHDADAVTRGIIAQVREQAGAQAPMPEVMADTLIVEKRATFKAAPGLARPPNTTPWPNVWVAGDWTDTGYPGVLEGAVRSGQEAARRASCPPRRA
ncbi:FAD-dependent oxidoreductase [Pusillimonas sp. TS35]|uniref:hydroxysqualene dehydroxylase n=1 Tax=Paracandidimonas lactea TaxID=2895524 RepID=UPI001369E8E9|nr:FAD-dependent oxidoreductase [Paracandidimonas lactea]MYN13827.1 FAD-dependent oxidoreductase [Pusillimonas sp. TS35]